MGRAKGRPLLFCTFVILNIDQSASLLTAPNGRHVQSKSRFAPLFRRRPQSPFVSLHATPKEDKIEKESLEEDVDDDFSKWVSSNLRQWPLVSSSSDEDDEVDGVPGKRATMNEAREDSIDNASTTPLKTTPSISEQQSSFRQIWNLEALLNLTMSTTSSILGESLSPSTAKQTVSEDPRNIVPSEQVRIDSMANATTRDWRTLEDIAVWNNFFRGSKKSSSSSSNATKVANQTLFETWVRQATTRVESLVSDASVVLSPEAIEKLISTRAATELLETAKRIALDRGMNVSIAARESASFARSFFQAADASIEQGRLFEDFETVSQLLDSEALAEAGRMGALSGAIYEDTVPRTIQLGESIVARGTTEDVVWMVTDGIGSDGLVRTITIRGYDASDEEVDREQLLNNICTALPEPLKGPKTLKVHAGLLAIARAIYRDVKLYIDWMAPTHKLVLNGHSVGGSLSLLVMLLIVNDLGVDFVKKRVGKVFMFGSPPVLADPLSLEKFEIPQDMVHGYVQPWDPIVRLFSSIDALYPLVSDLGADDSTPFADGPPRTLRPLTKAIIESWEGWPRFRENFRGTANQTYYSVGVQHIMLPEPTRYLADRFAAVNIPVPPIESVVRLSSKELQPVLSSIFPLDVFEISFVPQAIRSFVHHFYPAYWYPLVDYAKSTKRNAQTRAPERQQQPKASKWFSSEVQDSSSSKKQP